MNHKTLQGQSTVEYFILVAAVVAVIIVFLNISGSYRNSVQETVNAPVDLIGNAATSIPFP